MTQHHDIEILLVEADAWTVGVEAMGVLSVHRSTSEATSDLGAILGRRGPAPGGRRRRCVTMDGPGEDRRVWVDAALDTMHVNPRSMRPLPPFLRHVGVPAWWLGTVTVDDRLVLLVDLWKAAAENLS